MGVLAYFYDYTCVPYLHCIVVCGCRRETEPPLSASSLMDPVRWQLREEPVFIFDHENLTIEKMICGLKVWFIFLILQQKKRLLATCTGHLNWNYRAAAFHLEFTFSAHRLINWSFEHQENCIQSCL